MGIRVVAANSPLPDEAAGKMKLLGSMPDVKIKPSPYEAALDNDAALFDSVPGAGFDGEPASAAIVPPEGRLGGSGPALAIDPAQNNAYRAIARAWQQGATVQLVNGRFAIAGLSEAAQEALVKSLALRAERTASAAAAPLRPRRVGLYQPWTSSMDTGWSRWVLEQYGFSPIAVHPEDFRSGLGDKIDVLIIADDARVPIGAEGGVGRGGGTGPGRSGGGALRPEYAYQLSAADLEQFEDFIRSGGSLVCLSSASAFAIQQFKLPVKNAVSGLRSDEFFLRGSIVEVETNRAHPIMTGMPAQAAVFVDFSPVFETEEGFKGTVLARYAESGSPLLSGYLIGERRLHGKAAALDVQLGDGHVILIGFRPQWRGQPFGTFKVLFNAALAIR
jgi:hypothetical protein